MNLPELHDADVVICILPGGDEVFAKGADLGDVISRRGEARELVVERVPILSRDMLTALRRVLGTQV